MMMLALVLAVNLWLCAVWLHVVCWQVARFWFCDLQQSRVTWCCAGCSATWDWRPNRWHKEGSAEIGKAQFWVCLWSTSFCSCIFSVHHVVFCYVVSRVSE